VRRRGLALNELAAGYPRSLVEAALAEEIRRGRLRFAAGRYYLRRDCFDSEVLAALARLDLPERDRSARSFA
jgi:hypothetical protein